MNESPTTEAASEFVSAVDEILKVAEPGIRLALLRAYKRGRQDEARERRRPVLMVAELPQPMKADDVISAVVKATGVLDFRKRDGMLYARRYTRERQAAAILLREMAELSLPAIARVLGYTDHTSVMYALKNGPMVPQVAAIVQAARKHLPMPEAA
jgi:chromosomal replication initiation ATPase DnaA